MRNLAGYVLVSYAVSVLLGNLGIYLGSYSQGNQFFKDDFKDVTRANCRAYGGCGGFWHAFSVVLGLFNS